VELPARSLPLPRLEAGVNFIDDINAAFPADEFAAGMAFFRRF